MSRFEKIVLFVIVVLLIIGVFRAIGMISVYR